MAVKTLPNDIEAEQSVLGSMFLSKYALQQACETLTPVLFIWQVMLRYFHVFSLWLKKMFQSI